MCWRSHTRTWMSLENGTCSPQVTCHAAAPHGWSSLEANIPLPLLLEFGLKELNKIMWGFAMVRKWMLNLPANSDNDSPEAEEWSLVKSDATESGREIKNHSQIHASEIWMMVPSSAWCSYHQESRTLHIWAAQLPRKALILWKYALYLGWINWSLFSWAGKIIAEVVLIRSLCAVN